MIQSLTVSDVKRLFSSSNYRKGHSYYMQGRVKDLAYDSVREAWYAAVKGSKRYKVVVYESELGLEFECSCPAFDMYNEECKHVVAVMLEIQEQLAGAEQVSSREKKLQEIQQEQERMQEEYARQQAERQSVYVKQLTNQFITALANQQHEEVFQGEGLEKQPLLVEWICKVKQTYQLTVLTLEMKVGHKRTYVVKNIQDFLRAIRLKNQYPFTQTFTYDPTEYIFAERDQEIIDLLQEAIKYEEMYRNLQSPYAYGTTPDTRAVTISPMLADQFAEKLAGRPIKFENKGKAYEQLYFLKNELPFSIQLDQGSKEAFQLDVSDFGFVEYLDLYGYVVKENEVYQLTQVQQSFVKEVKKFVQLAHTPIIPISHEQIGPLLSNAGPVMNEVGRLEIADNISAKIIKFPLKAKVFVDCIDGSLRVTMEYQYGEHTINPFMNLNQPDTDSILMRNTEKEQMIMNVLEDSALKSNGQFLYLDREEEIFEFLYEILPRLEGLADIFLTKPVKSFILPEQHSPMTHIDVDTSGN